MRYNFNGKPLEIPDNEIENNIKFLGVSKEDAIQIWLEDNGKIHNAEQEELNANASKVKILHQAKNEKPKSEKPPRKPRTYNNTDEKVMLFKRIYSFVQGVAEEVGGELTIEKEDKKMKLTFPNNDRPITIDLIQARKKRGE